MRETYFVYQAHLSGRETLYKRDLTDTEADRAWAELDRLIEGGGCGDGCAVVGNLDEESDKYVAQRLGLL